MIRYLNLYGGLGGNALKISRTNVKVTAVENNPKIAAIYVENNPEDEVIVGDAHEYLLRNHQDYDFIWSSPPCQSHSRMMKATRHDVRKYPDMTLYQEIIFLQHFFKGKWIVENVKPYYEPLINPTIEMGRHLIWSNFDISPFEIPKFANLINSTTVKAAEDLKKWLGIKYEGNLYTDGNHHPTQALRNCVHPDMGLHIFNCSVSVVKQKEPIIDFGLFQNE